MGCGTLTDHQGFGPRREEEPIAVSLMPSSKRTLPDFKAPPVVEVALGVQFDPPFALTSAQLGRIWDLYKGRFPKTQDQPPLPSVIETPDLAGPQPARLRLIGTPLLPRCWFLNDSESELLQVQDDKFIRNWRKTQDAAEYPRYETIREGFKADLISLSEFISREKLGSFRPSQCEITYVNHIQIGHSAIDEAFRMWRPTEGEFLPRPEDVRVALRYPIKDDSGAFLGRLNVDLQPAFLNVDQSPILVLSLTARGRPDGSGLNGVFQFLDRGREWIVRGFAEVTVPEIQARVWKRIQ